MVRKGGRGSGRRKGALYARGRIYEAGGGGGGGGEEIVQLYRVSVCSF